MSYNPNTTPQTMGTTQHPNIQHPTQTYNPIDPNPPGYPPKAAEGQAQGQTPLSPLSPVATMQQPPPLPPQQQPLPLHHPPTYRSATPLAALGQYSAPVECPLCGAREVTRTQHVVGDMTHLWALLICFVTCLGCIPYMTTCFKDVEHCCGRCGRVLAVWKRSGGTEVVAHAFPS